MLRRGCLYNIVYRIYIDGNLSYDKYIYMSKNMVFELLVSFGIQMVKY
jgi:hypothetical protein